VPYGKGLRDRTAVKVPGQAGVAVIGYADKPGKAQDLACIQAAAVTTDLSEITTALRTTA